MRASVILAAGLLAALAASGAAPASAQSFYGVTYSSGQFLSVSGTDGTASQTGSLATGVTPDGLALYNGGLYTFDSATDSLLRLDPATGATAASVAVGLSGPVAPGGLAISSSGLAFLAVPDAASPQAMPTSTLYSFNLSGGPAVLVGRTADLLSGLAFSADDTLYGLGKGDGQLYTINTASAAGTLVGNLDSTGGGTVGNSPIGAITFSGGTLYAAADDTLYTVSTADGSATLIGPIVDSGALPVPYSSVSGLAPAAVPEASTVLSFGALLALGGVLVLRRRAAPQS
jgi:hypothetical protein